MTESSDTDQQSKSKEKDIPEKGTHLRQHCLLTGFLYFISFAIAYFILSLIQARTNISSFISTGAILATFGAAISSLGAIWAKDQLERVLLNADILFRDIYKNEKPWRRWPFLPRNRKLKLFNRKQMFIDLNNPKILLDVGTHILQIDLPTVLDDFFDLPILKNILPLFRFRSAAHTILSRRKNDEVNPETGLKPFDEYMAYECMYDIWSAVLIFRIARYSIHFGSGLIIFSFLGVAIFYKCIA